MTSRPRDDIPGNTGGDDASGGMADEPSSDHSDDATPDDHPDDGTPDGHSGDLPGDDASDDETPAGNASEDAPDAAPVVLPEGLEDVPPGPVLGEMLDEVPVASVSGFDTVAVLQAASRQLAYQQVVFYEALVETGLRAPGSVGTVRRRQLPGEFACEEARAALVWSRSRAGNQYQLGYDLCVRLPDLGRAMKRGQLDLPRAKAFVDWTDGLTDTQAAQVCTHLIPTATGLTVGELVDQIKRVCLAVDPAWAEKKYRNALRARKVAGYRNPDGTATLAGQHQPLDRVAAACARIDTLARGCKHAGDTRKIDHIRSDLFLGLTDGTFEGFSEQQIIDHVLAHPYTEPDTTTDDTGRGDTGPGGGGNGGSGPGSSSGSGNNDTGGSGVGGHSGSGGSGSSGGTSGHPSGGGSRPGGGRGQPPARDAGPAEDSDGGRTASHGERPGRAGPPGTLGGSGRSNGDHGPGARRAASGDDPGRDDASGTDGPAADASRPAGRAWAAPELRVALATLLGLDEQPGQMPGWGPVPADLARRLVDDMHRGEWRWVVCDPGTGRPVAGGLLLTRPGHDRYPRTRVPRDARRGGIVELAATTIDLVQLIARAGERGPWAPVIRSIAADYHRWRADTSRADTAHTADNADNDGASASSGADAHSGDSAAGDGPGGRVGGGGFDGEARRRVPGARLRRWIQLRDRQCSYPGCRAPAAAGDVDHRVDHAAGGLTVPENLHPPCRHDHRVKHDGGWQIHPGPGGATVWTSPLGHRHLNRPPPVLPPPPPPTPRHLDPHWQLTGVNSREAEDGSNIIP